MTGSARIVRSLRIAYGAKMPRRKESNLSANRSRWSGELWLGSYYALFHGVAGHSSVHRHYAHQGISLQMPGEVRPWAWVASLSPHRVDEPDASMLAVYAEPMVYNLGELKAIAGYNPTDLSALAQAMLHIPRKAVSVRLQRALLRVDAQLEGKISAADLAHQAQVSQSHLHRLFNARLGLSVRRMVLWRRLRRALCLVFEGHSLTQAAHAAGFADSAHLSRTLRDMFGISGQQDLGQIRLRLLPSDD